MGSLWSWGPSPDLWWVASPLGLETYADETVERCHRPKLRLFTVSGEGGGRTPGQDAVRGWVLPWPTLHLFVFSLGPTVFSESVPVCPSVGPVLMCMRRKGAAVRLAFIREGQGSSCGDQGRPGCPFPRQAAGATPSPGNVQGHQDCPSGSQLLRLAHTPVSCRSPV